MKRILICFLALLSLLSLVSCRPAGNDEFPGHYVLSQSKYQAVPALYFSPDGDTFRCSNALVMNYASTGSYRTVGRYIYAETDELRFVLKKQWNGRLKIIAYQSENDYFDFHKGDIFKVLILPEE